ncbi:ATP-binding protein [Rhizobium sp. HT1-10]|uniref:ATP-binding protein n=1 Tax=Rhizobium sp. HT1-10 TaxID=3111638 RepID=UPI003C181393
MESTLQGRLRNTHLPASKAMIPLYEAIVNSIHAIEEQAALSGRPVRDHTIAITVIREETLLSSTDGRSEDRIDGFLIEDNGIGFTEENWSSFKTLDSLYKAQKGSRGIGRLMWLKAFRDVRIDSVFGMSDATLLRRIFTFNPDRDVVPDGDPQKSSAPRGTSVSLKGFVRAYADQSPKTLRAIAGGILEHCLWYFVRAEGVPMMRVIDNAESILLDDLFDEHMHSDARAEELLIGEHPFEITHVKFRANLNKSNTLNYCAAGRLVKGESLKGRVPGLTSTMCDDQGTFTYAAYLTGPYLDERVVEQRIGFHIEDEGVGLFSGAELTFQDIRDAVVPRVKSFLEASLRQNIEASAERIDSFIQTKAPRYKAVLRHVDTEELIVDPNTSDRDLDIVLHRQLYKLEERILEEGHDIMVPLKDETEVDYQNRLEKYLNTVADLNESSLVDYVTHRRIILDLLGAAIYQDDDGKFAREDKIHELIVPMRKTSEDYEFRRENLWLIDERLAFHDFLASDKPLSAMPITSDSSGKEPDVVALRMYDMPVLLGEKGPPPASLTVIEIKKPMRKGYIAGKDEKSDPILQSLDYLSRLRNGAATRRGRKIPNAEQIPGFIYVIADLTDDLVQSCELFNLTKTADGMGYFGHHPKPAYNAYIQVISFDGLLKSAKERHRAFFEKLGFPPH